MLKGIRAEVGLKIVGMVFEYINGCKRPELYILCVLDIYCLYLSHVRNRKNRA
jgi:hypothetical protein